MQHEDVGLLEMIHETDGYPRSPPKSVCKGDEVNVFRGREPQGLLVHERRYWNPKAVDGFKPTSSRRSRAGIPREHEGVVMNDSQLRFLSTGAEVEGSYDRTARYPTWRRRVLQSNRTDEEPALQGGLTGALILGAAR